MPRLHIGRPLWIDRAPKPQTTYAALRGAQDADIAIIGGGITGMITAWRFAAAGIRVAVLEAQRVGRGSTAASTALLMQEPDEDFIHLERRYGAARTRRIWQLSRRATRDFVRAIRRLRIRCDLHACDSVYYSLTRESEPSLRREHRRRSGAGLGGRWLDGAALKAAAGFEGVAIRTRGNAQIDPYRACGGFARAAVESGARIFERSPVERVVAAGDRVTLATRGGEVRASRVVVATGYATPSFERLEARFRMLNTYVIVTRPLTPRERRMNGLGDVMLWDDGHPYHYARWTPDHRLMLGGADRPRVTDHERGAALRKGIASLREFFIERYPRLADIELEYAWEGLFATTPDGLPYIGPHRRFPRHLFALGYGGNGMTFGFLAADLLLDWHRGRRTADHDLFAFGRLR
jgi:glycine/D-amino acid oxidase-like deaminating enzyme